MNKNSWIRFTHGRKNVTARQQKLHPSSSSNSELFLLEVRLLSMGWGVHLNLVRRQGEQFWTIEPIIGCQPVSSQAVSCGLSRGQPNTEWLGPKNLWAVGLSLVCSTDCKEQAKEVLGIQKLLSKWRPTLPPHTWGIYIQSGYLSLYVCQVFEGRAHSLNHS